MRNYLPKSFYVAAIAVSACAISVWSSQQSFLEASSHREAPLISKDPLADNTDLYAFRNPSDPTKVVILANYIPFQLPQAGPNYYTFGENVRYEVHIKNNTATTGDDITYRFTFTRTNQDPSTFFYVRLGQQNLKTTYTCQKSVAGGAFTTIVANGIVPPYNAGPRIIENNVVGLGANYNTLMTSAIATATGGGGESIYCGSIDDPFFGDIGAIFDLANIRPNAARDGIAKKNVHTIALSIPIATLQKNGNPVSMAANILDPNYVIGVWASASRPAVKTLSTTPGNAPTETGNYIQVSRLGMPLTNEVINPLAAKDRFNVLTPYNEDAAHQAYFTNPELALYMDSRPAPTAFGAAVPGLSALRIQSNSLQTYDFRNGQPGLFPLKGNAALTGTALAPGPSAGGAGFGDILLQQGKPRSVDILPIFYTGVPNLRPYQLATGKAGNPLAAGKPFIHNFLPTLGDMLRLNMAVPVTPRNSPDFSSEGLLHAAVLGLTDARFNTNANLQFIPNMDGFPNGRRLEDDVVRIELQAVSGVVLAAIGLWYDDYTAGAANPVTPQLQNVLTFKTGVERNDTTFKTAFPYAQTPWRGFNVRAQNQ